MMLQQAAIVYLLVGVLLGGTVAWIIATLIAKSKMIAKAEATALQQQLDLLKTHLSVENAKSQELSNRFIAAENELKTKIQENNALTAALATKTTEFLNSKTQAAELKASVDNQEKTAKYLQQQLEDLTSQLAAYKANLTAANDSRQKAEETITGLANKLETKIAELHDAHKQIAALMANNEGLKEKLATQKLEIEALRKQFNTEFENIANRILEEKTQKFTTTNQTNLKSILDPLHHNLKDFKQQVEQAYYKEAQERFSLRKEIEGLMQLNQKISEDANNLTNALKGNAKTQGDWGQMILENILEKSGLIKNSEYFVQEYLKDEDGNYVKNADGSKMQPDVIIAYPDNRKIIIDAKVSLTAYIRYTEAETREKQQQAIDEHLKSIRRHIEELSKKNYQDFAPTLDYVMMFVPNEPAYLLALQHESELWHYAYSKKIVFISPTNLIAVLKLIESLWKHEYQNRNTQAIAARGAALYDKFVNFVTNLTELGANLVKAQASYHSAWGQLTEGRGNLIAQVEKLKKLGLKTKKQLPSTLLTGSVAIEHDSTETA